MEDLHYELFDLHNSCFDYQSFAQCKDLFNRYEVEWGVILTLEERYKAWHTSVDAYFENHIENCYDTEYEDDEDNKERDADIEAYRNEIPKYDFLTVNKV